jgi:O-acetylhomoserine/O-acetylserine sulfhydrylase-like pyridoxal-dependent enzyme
VRRLVRGFPHRLKASYTVCTQIIADIESAPAGALVLTSGMAAITTAFAAVLSRGDHVVAPVAAYGGTVEWFNSFLGAMGCEVTYVDGTDLGAYARAARPNTK